MYRIIGADHREYGPVSADQIRQWIKEGRVNGATLMQAEGVPGWRPLATFAEFGVPPQHPPAAPTGAPTFTPTPAPTAPTNGNAITGLVFGILSVTCVCGGLPMGGDWDHLFVHCVVATECQPRPKGQGNGDRGFGAFDRRRFGLAGLGCVFVSAAP